MTSHVCYVRIMVEKIIRGEKGCLFMKCILFDCGCALSCGIGFGWVFIKGVESYLAIYEKITEVCTESPAPAHRYILQAAYIHTC